MSEPSLLVYDVENVELSRAANGLLKLIAPDLHEDGVLERCLEQRKRRLCAFSQSTEDTVRNMV